MSKLYFGSTNAYFITIAVDEESNRACYMIEDGMEGKTYPSHFDLQDMEEDERKAICEEWLREIAECNSFEDLYSNCDVESGYCGIFSADDALSGTDILAAIDF